MWGSLSVVGQPDEFSNFEANLSYFQPLLEEEGGFLKRNWDDEFCDADLVTGNDLSANGDT